MSATEQTTVTHTVGLAIHTIYLKEELARTAEAA